MTWVSVTGDWSPNDPAGKAYEESPYKNLGGEFAGRPNLNSATFEYATDPMVGAGFEAALKGVQTDYSKVFRGVASREADVSTRSLQGALASRGGGNIGLSGLGAQARAGVAIGAEAQAIQASQAAQDTLLNMLTQKYNVVSQILGIRSGNAQAALAYHAARKAAEANVTAAQWGAAGSVYSQVPD